MKFWMYDMSDIRESGGQMKENRYARLP